MAPGSAGKGAATGTDRCQLMTGDWAQAPFPSGPVGTAFATTRSAFVRGCSSRREGTLRKTVQSRVKAQVGIYRGRARAINGVEKKNRGAQSKDDDVSSPWTGLFLSIE